jgi:uncharacterized protein DUF2695
MPSRPEIERRKLLLREVADHARADEEAQMPISRAQLADLFSHLDGALDEGCDHTSRLTEAFLRARGLPEATIILWLRQYGGYCDCEVLANVEERWRES